MYFKDGRFYVCVEVEGVCGEGGRKIRERCEDAIGERRHRDIKGARDQNGRARKKYWCAEGRKW